MTIIELVVFIAVLVAVAAVVSSISAIPAPTKRIVNIGIGAILGIVILVFLLSLLGVGLHRRI